MLNAVGEVSGLLAAVPGVSGSAPGPGGQGGFGPDYVLELGRKRYGGVPGYNALVNFGAATTQIMQQQVQQAGTPVPIFSEKQARQINETVSAAAAALGRGDTQEARARTQELLARDLNDPVGHHLLGRITAAEGNLEEAVGHFERASNLAPGNQRFADDAFNSRQLLRSDRDVMKTASELVRRRDTAVNGIRLLFELSGRSPQLGRIHLLMSEGFKTLDLPLQQLKALDAAVQGAGKEELGELQQRVSEFIRSHEPTGLAHSIHGRVLYKMGRTDQAIQELETAVDIAPQSRRYTVELADLHAAVGRKALSHGKLSAAEYRFEKARGLDPLSADHKLGLAEVLVSKAQQQLSRGLDTEARGLLGRAESLLAGDDSLDLQMATAYMRLGQRAQAEGLNGLAVVNYEDAYARNPDLGGLKRSMADIHRAQGQAVLDAEPYAQMSTSDFETVVDSFQKAYDLFPNRSSYKTSLAEVLNEFGLKLMNEQQNYDRAQEMFGRARDLVPGNADYQANYAQAMTLKLSG